MAGGCRSRGSGLITSLICACGSGCATRWLMINASGSSGSGRGSTTHHGSPHRLELTLLTAAGREWLEQLPLPAVACEQIAVGLLMSDELDAELPPITKQLCSYARRQPGCKALMGCYGIGVLTSVTILAELGDVRRFSSSREAVRYDGMDITVHASDRHRTRHLSRQGPPTLRWALYEAAQAASRAGSPDREYYLQGWSPRAQRQHPLNRAHAPPGESRNPPGGERRTLPPSVPIPPALHSRRATPLSQAPRSATSTATPPPHLHAEA
jgi:hypothetical protein